MSLKLKISHVGILGASTPVNFADIKGNKGDKGAPGVTGSTGRDGLSGMKGEHGESLLIFIKICIFLLEKYLQLPLGNPTISIPLARGGSDDLPPLENK